VTYWDAVVVGAGLGGLTTAAYLATNGLRTLVLEQGKVAGGCSQVFRRRGRYEFDVGVHYVGDCQPGGTMWSLLRSLGLEESVEFTELDPDGFSTLVFPDFTFRVPRGWDAYLGRLLETFPSEERGIRRCVRLLRAIGAELDGNFPVGVRQVMAFPRQAPLTTTIGSAPLASLYRSCGLSEPVRAVLSGESGAYAAPPSRVPISLHAAFLHHNIKAGAFYPRGGGQVLAARLVEVIETYDGQIRTATHVQRIEVAGGRVQGVRSSDGELHRAPVVVSNADPQTTYGDLVGHGHLSRRTVRRMQNARMAPPVFSVYLGLDLDVTKVLSNTNVFSHPHTDIEAIYQDYYAGRLPDRLPFFLASASLKDPGNPRTAPPGHSTLELMAMVPAGSDFWGVGAGGRDRLGYRSESAYQEKKEAVAQALVERASSVIPDLASHVVLQDASTPITHERFTGASDGACYGWELSTGQVGLRRPGPGTEIGGLFLVGASTRWCHGVMGVMNGGVGTAGAVLGRDIRREVLAGRVFGEAGRLPAGGPQWDPLVVSRGRRRHQTSGARSPDSSDR